MSKRMSEERLKHIKDQYDHYGEAALGGGELLAEIDALRAELAAARERENETAGRVEAAILSLTAAKAEAERLLSHRTKDMQRWIDHHDARAATAERERDEARAALAQARADALEEAAKVVDDLERTINRARNEADDPSKEYLQYSRAQLFAFSKAARSIRTLKGELRSVGEP